MAKVIVEYTARIKQEIYWPDDELDHFTYDNVQANLEPSADDVVDEEFDVLSIKLNGEEHDF